MKNKEPQCDKKQPQGDKKQPQDVKKERRIRCNDCHDLFPREELIFGPSPFASEIHNNDTDVYLCKSCHHNSCMEI